MNYNFKENDIININNDLRLRVPLKNEWNKALEWYSNRKILYYSEGLPMESSKTYQMDTINNMYTYLNQIGIVFFIEIYEDNNWQTIGDATLFPLNMPIMIGYEKYWSKKIGTKVLETLLNLANQNHITTINVSIYKYNKRSQNLYTAFEFKQIGEDENEYKYEWNSN